MPNPSPIRIAWNGEWREASTPDMSSPAMSVEELAPGHYLVRDGERTFEVFEHNGMLSDGVNLDGVEVRIESNRERIIRERFGSLNAAGKSANGGNHIVKAPMPGMVRAVKVTAGDIVERNSTLLVLEAMKMENNILAGMSGLVVRVHAAEGKSVERNAVLVEIQPTTK